MNKYKTLRKTPTDRIFELSRSLSIIRDSIKSIRKGQLYQILPMSGQLRALLTEKSKNNKPLLLVLAKEQHQELNIFAMKEFDTGLSLTFSMSGFPVSLAQESHGQESISLEAFLERPIITVRDNSYSMRKIIEFYANKAGGSHYAPDLPKDFVELLTINIFGLTPFAHSLLQFGEVVYQLGYRLIKQLTDFEAHLLLLIPQKLDDNQAYIFDFKHPHSQMRIFLSIYPSIRPCFEVHGLDGNGANVILERIINWNDPHHVMLSIELENDLSTTLSITVDGERLARTVSPELILVANDPSIYELYINRSFEDAEAGLMMACSRIVGFNRNLSALERAGIFLAFNDQISQNEIPCTYFVKGAYAHLPLQKKEIVYSENCTEWDMKKLARGEFPSSCLT